MLVVWTDARGHHSPYNQTLKIHMDSIMLDVWTMMPRDITPHI